MWFWAVGVRFAGRGQPASGSSVDHSVLIHTGPPSPLSLRVCSLVGSRLGVLGGGLSSSVEWPMVGGSLFLYSWVCDRRHVLACFLYVKGGKGGGALRRSLRILR